MSPTDLHGALLEREAELDEMERAVERDVCSGEGAVMLLEGPAGIGKSRLLEAGCHAANERGLQLPARSRRELEQDFAYGVVRQLLERRIRGAKAKERAGLLTGAAHLAAPALGLSREEAVPAGGGDASFPVAHGLYWLVSNLAEREPVMISVDDAHWSDAPSLRFLLYLFARLEGLPALVLLAARPGEPGIHKEFLQRIAADARTQVLKPAALSTEAVGEIASRRLGTPSAPEFVRSAHRSTGGNPFLLHELLGALQADGFTADTKAAERVTGLGPETVSRSLLLRLARLPEPCAALARGVAVLGASADLDSAAALAGLDLQVAGQAADSLAAVQILAPGTPLSFVHPVVREAIYADLPASRCAAMHAAAAEVLAKAGAAPDGIAPHLLVTPSAERPEVVETLRAAAQRALGQGAADLAQRYLRRAFAEPPAPELTAAVAGELGTAEWLAAEDPVAAIEHLEQAMHGTDDPTERAGRLLVLTRAIASTGQVERAYDVLDRELAALEAGPSRTDPEALKRVEAELGSVGLLQAATRDRARERLERLDAVKDDSVADLLLLSNLAASEWLDGTAERTVELAQRSLGGGRLQAAEGADSIAVLQAGWVLADAERSDLAREVADATIADARARGSVFGFTASTALRAIVMWRLGDVRAAEAEARNGIEMSSPPPFVRAGIYSYLALPLIERGELDEAEEAVLESGCGPWLPEIVHMNHAFFASGRLRLAQGRPEDALADFKELGRRDARLLIRNPGLAWRTGAVEAHLLLGNGDEARRLAAEQMRVALHWGTGTARGVALRVQGLAEGAEGLELLREATTVLERSPARLEHARALVDLGAATRRAGSRAEAREPLKAGLEAARRCGATVLAERAHAELVTAGARPRRLMFSGVESLTASERRVAELAAGGQTNREIAQALFVTPKTVENHLSHAYGKLGIASRDRLAETLAQREPVRG